MEIFILFFWTLPLFVLKALYVYLKLIFLILCIYCEAVLKYPWAVLIFNRLSITCLELDEVMTMNRQNFEEHAEEIPYDFCSGTLITNKHILTTAECVAENRERDAFTDHTSSIAHQYHQMQSTPHGSAFPATKIDVVYNRPCNIYALMGYTDINKAKVKDEELAKIKKITSYSDQHHEHYSFSNGYNYNLGRLVILP